ncbi:MAG: protease inhibitor I42 family protein [Methanosarcinaceae archaeon]|nr:protease inhibitor I42 family protein [Methanosarcinaceae archaeon]
MEKKKSLSFLKLLAALLLIASITMSGCVDDGNMDEPEDSAKENPSQEEKTAEEYEYGIATVENIEIYIMESFPVQVSVEVNGYFQDGCTEIEAIKTERYGNTFEANISTKRPKGAICTQAIVPFTKMVSLDVFGLRAGSYNVSVNGVTDSFELEVDNIPDGETFTEADNGKTVSLENGDIFILELPENPSTGYSWELGMNMGIDILEEGYIQDEKPLEMVGVGGTHFWIIKADSSGSQKISAVYKQFWEEETGDEERFELTIEVV